MVNKTQQRASTWFIIFIVAIAAGSTLASDMYLPSFPALTQAFTTSKSMIQLTLTAYLLGFSLFQLAYGPLSDRFGRKPLVLIGTGICLIGTLICALSTNLLVFLDGRFLQGVGAAAGMSLARVMARDAFEGDELSKVFSIMGMIFAVSFAVAPAIGGYLQTFFGWQANFILISLYMLAVLVIAWFYLPETNQHKDPHATEIPTLLSNYKTLFTHKTFMSFSIAYGLTWSGLIAYATISPFLFVKVMGFSPILYGHLAIATTIGLIAASFINKSLVTQFGHQTMMATGLVTMLIAAIIMCLYGFFGVLNLWVVMIPFCIFVLGIGIVSANAGAGALSPFGHIAGVAGSLYGCLQILITFIASYIFAHLPIYSQMTLAWVLLILALGAGAVWLIPTLTAKQS